MQFYYIRHGQSTNNLLFSQTGAEKGRSDDAELTEVGRRQAELVAQVLSRPYIPTTSEGDRHNRNGFGITHLYSSLMLRAVATGNIIADALDLPQVAWLDAYEAGGIYLEDPETGANIGRPGKNRAYFEAHFPHLALPAELGEEGWWNRPFETKEQRPIRAQRFWEELQQRHGQTEDRVALVSHGAFYNYLMAAILKLPTRDHVWFMLHNAAITRLDLNNGYVDVAYTNRTDFLPAELVT